MLQIDTGRQPNESTGGTGSTVKLPPITGSDRPIDIALDGEDWRIEVRKQLLADMKDWSDASGSPAWQMENWLTTEMETLMHWVDPFVLTTPKYQEIAKSIPEGMGAVEASGVNTPYYNGLINPFAQPVAGPDGIMYNPGIEAIYKLLRQKIATVVPGFDGTVVKSGGGGGGSRPPTADEIRAQFDIEQLTKQAQKLARAYLVEDHPDPKGIASAYINQVVATGGKQQLDFQTFVVGRLEKTARWKQVQRGNQGGVDPLEYVSQYGAMALQALGGNRGLGVSKVVGEGGALGAAPGAFQARLMREDAVRNQSSFIAGLEQRLSKVNKVLR